MKTTRRSFLRTAAMLSTQPLILGGLQACGDDEGTVNPQPDAGGGDGFDMDGSGMTDGSADTDVEVPDEPDTLPQYEYNGEPGAESLFSHGVASGDPLSDAVIIWTRVTPEVEGPAEVWYEVSRDVDFTRRVEVGTFTTGPERDYTVKYDAVGLDPGRTYYFRFKYLGRTSPVGRMRTAPVGDVSKLRFAVCSCSSWGHGYFHAYRGIGERNDLAAVLHLGDYIYEYGTNEYGRIRSYEPANEIVSLSDYRTRYAQYRTDENLQFMHQQHPIIAVWDDHETADNSWRDGANNHSEGSEGAWADRKAAAFQAYMEWMPIREQEEFKIWRSFNYGNLLDLVMLDTRIWGRDVEVAGSDIEGINAPDRQLLGADQEAWVLQTLEESSARWKVIGQQVMVGNWKSFGALDSEGGGGVTNGDQWDGYRPAREKFFDAIESTDAGTVVVLTGDIHSSWAHNLARDPNNPESYNPTTFEGSIAVEYVVPGISSPGFPRAVGEAFVLTARDNNPTLQWAELANRGYLVLDVTPERVQGAWFHYEDVIDPDPTAFPEFFQVAWATEYGTGYLVEDAAPAEPIADAPDLV